MKLLKALLVTAAVGLAFAKAAEAQDVFVGIQTLDQEGTIELSEDEKTIKSISPKGFFVFRRNTRKIEVRSDSNGKLSYLYKEGFSEEPFEPKGREWLAEILPMLIKDGFAAESRSKRIFEKEGTKGVLKAIVALGGDYAKGKYYKYLLQNTLSANDIQEIAEHLGEQMQSDYEIAQVLKKLPIQDQTTAQAYLKIVAKIDSDYEQKQALKRIFEENLNLDWFEGIFETIAKNMNSDYEKAEILTKAAKLSLTEKQLTGMLAVLKSMDSDYEKARILKRLNEQKLDGKQVVAVLEISREMDSDYERKNVLSGLVQNQTFDTAAWLAFLKTTQEIGSDYEKSQVLLKAKEKIPFDIAEVKDSYIKTAETIKSDHEYSRVVRGVR